MLTCWWHFKIFFKTGQYMLIFFQRVLHQMQSSKFEYMPVDVIYKNICNIFHRIIGQSSYSSLARAQNVEHWHMILSVKPPRNCAYQNVSAFVGTISTFCTFSTLLILLFKLHLVMWLWTCLFLDIWVNWVILSSRVLGLLLIETIVLMVGCVI